MTIWKIIHFIFIVLALGSCNGQVFKKQTIPYNLSAPDAVIKLNSELREVSGLTFLANGQLLCHNDENMTIYKVNYQTDSNSIYYQNSLAGDFEGIEYVNGTIYLLSSNGTVFEINDSVGKQVRQFKTILTRANDTEGLAYDKSNNSLLIACKNKPGFVDTTTYCRGIYRFDLNTNQLIEKPFITIDLNELAANFGVQKFMPSGIAVHPQTGDFYIISAEAKGLLIIDKEFKLKAFEKLDSKLYKQPEGICFTPDGEFLFIANEGKKGNANILKIGRI